MTPPNEIPVEEVVMLTDASIAPVFKDSTRRSALLSVCVRSTSVNNADTSLSDWLKAITKSAFAAVNPAVKELAPGLPLNVS